MHVSYDTGVFLRVVMFRPHVQAADVKAAGDGFHGVPFGLADNGVELG